MQGPLNVKFANAKQAKEIYQYRNTREKLFKMNAAIWYNKICRAKQLASNYEGWNFNSGNYLFTTDTK